MALVKNIKTNNGVTTNYHKINNFSVYSLNGGYYDVHLTVDSYVNEDIRRSIDGTKVSSKVYIIKVNIHELENTPMMKLLYTKLKALDAFKDAVNA